MTYKIIGKYIKDLKFSIPNAKVCFSLSKDIANYKINIDIKSNQIKENIIEVLTSLRLMPTKNDSEKIETNIETKTIAPIAIPIPCVRTLAIDFIVIVENPLKFLHVQIIVSDVAPISATIPISFAFILITL